MRAAIIFGAALVLSGCQTVPRIEVQRVEVPVAVPCVVKMPDKPTWATSVLPKSPTIWDQTKALLAERRQRIGYEAELEAAASSCSAPSPLGK